MGSERLNPGGWLYADGGCYLLFLRKGGHLIDEWAVSRATAGWTVYLRVHVP
jgi:hypothetical protein